MRIGMFLGDQDNNDIAKIIFSKWKVWTVYVINLLCFIIVRVCVCNYQKKKL